MHTRNLTDSNYWWDYRCQASAYYEVSSKTTTLFRLDLICLCLVLFQALSKRLYRKCKCHGVCGSCELKTCWIQHPVEFDNIGSLLLAKYKTAIEMVKTKRGPRVLRVKDKNAQKPSPDDLIYFRPSPNFCDVNTGLGTPGTSGRVCNITSSSIDGCNILCCGRGYNVQVISETVKCNCRFFWCCHIKCDTCKNRREVYTCK